MDTAAPRDQTRAASFFDNGGDPACFAVFDLLKKSEEMLTVFGL
jgi:hypothetical protein